MFGATRRALARKAPTADLYRAWFADLVRRDRPTTVLNLLDAALAKSVDEGDAPRAERELAAEQARAMAQALRAEPDWISEPKGDRPSAEGPVKLWIT